MSCIVKRKNKKTGAVYAFLQESYRDPVTKKPRNTRTYLGRVDPDTGEIIAKKEKLPVNGDEVGHTGSAEQEIAIQKLQSELKKKEEQIRILTDKLKEQEKAVQSLLRSMKKIRALTEIDPKNG